MCVGDVSFGVTCRAGNTFRYLGRKHGSTEATGIARAATAGGELIGWQSEGRVFSQLNLVMADVNAKVGK